MDHPDDHDDSRQYQQDVNIATQHGAGREPQGPHENEDNGNGDEHDVRSFASWITSPPERLDCPLYDWRVCALAFKLVLPTTHHHGVKPYTESLLLQPKFLRMASGDHPIVADRFAAP